QDDPVRRPAARDRRPLEQRPPDAERAALVEHVSRGGAAGPVTRPRARDAGAMTGPLLLRHRLQVRFSDCDPLGHVNNATYLTYLEQARLVLWRGQIGSWARLRPDGKRGEGFILARAEIDFRAQARDGDELEVRLALCRFRRTRATCDYEVGEFASRVR